MAQWYWRGGFFLVFIFHILKAMGIKENAIKVLVTMAEYGKKPNDPDRGRYNFAAKEFSQLTGLHPNDLSDAIDFLDSQGYVKALRYLGTRPYSFGGAVLTTEGRLEAEKYSGKPQVQEIDALLQIRNRGVYDSDFPRIVGQCQMEKLPAACLMIDLDNFKSFNDNHGHDAGDAVLKAAAASVRNTLGSKGTCYRYGGEEIVVILPNYTRAEAVPLAERIRITVASIELTGLPRITVSIGVGLTESVGYKPEDLFRAADNALYAAKHEGRNTVKVSD